MKIKIDDFAAMIPRMEPRNLPARNASLARHCHFRRGHLEPLINAKAIASYTGPALKSIYWHVPISQTDHNVGALIGTTDISDIVVSPIADDSFKRIYITDDNAAALPAITADSLIPSTQNISLNTVAPVGLNANTWGVGQVAGYNLEIPPPVSAPASVVIPVPVGDILSITMTDPVVITAGLNGVPVPHGGITGDRVEITGATSVTDLNGIWSTTVVSTTRVELDGSLGSIWTGAYVASEASGHLYWDQLEADSRLYVFTFVSSWGEETAPSVASPVIDVGPRQGVTVSGIIDCPLFAAGNTRWDGAVSYKKRLYRSNSGAYQFVADIPHGTTAYTDNIDNEFLGDELLSKDWDIPPADLHGLKAHPGGFLVGLSGSDLCFSEAGHPHAWPIKYRMKLDNKGIGIGIYGTSVACLTEGNPEVATGTHPSSMVKERVEIYQSCTSSRGIVDAGYSIIYPSPYGLAAIGIGANGIASDNLHTKQQWEATQPATIRSGYYDDKYYCFFNGPVPVPPRAGLPAQTYKGIVVDLRYQGEGVVMTDQQVDCAYYDAVSDNLFLSGGGASIVLLERDSTLTQYDWWSKFFFLPRHGSFGAAVVHALTHVDVVFEFWGVDINGTWEMIHTQTVTNDSPFRMPAGALYQEVMLRVSGSDIVVMMAVAETMSELKTI